MSQEAIEAVFSCSSAYSHPLMLIASRNQIDWDCGYVLTTKEYGEYIRELKRQYPDADVKICRDHCGPGFRSGQDDLESLKNTIKSDLENGFKLIHFDLCRLEGSHEHQLEATAELAKFAQDIDSGVELEIGTDENTEYEATLGRIRSDLEYFLKFCTPAFYVIPTGSLVKEARNVGTFREEFMLDASEVVHEFGVNIKEHNADYLGKEELLKRRGVIDALNIAPQIGVLQTSLLLNKARLYGVDTTEFEKVIWEGRNWEKWLLHGSSHDELLCATLAGHYHYASSFYDNLIGALDEYIDTRSLIIEEVSDLILHYSEYFDANS